MINQQGESVQLNKQFKRTRFAPSPTGYLHIGHILSAIFVWTIARYTKAEVLLRIEDHDLSRARKEYEKAIPEDLKWLGFIPDIMESPHNPYYKQSLRFERYEQILNKIKTQHSVYSCDCSRKKIIEKMQDRKPGQELRYDGHCREKQLSNKHGIRLQIDNRTLEFNDLFLGIQKQTPAKQCGDILLKDRDGQWSYQFAVAVDDWDQDCDLIIRGQDLTESTGRQILLSQVIGRPNPPTFLHHPLIHDQKGVKLSKRDMASSVRDLKNKGYTSEEVIGQALYLGNIISSQRPVKITDLAEIIIKNERI